MFLLLNILLFYYYILDKQWGGPPQNPPYNGNQGNDWRDQDRRRSGPGGWQDSGNNYGGNQGGNYQGDSGRYNNYGNDNVINVSGSGCLSLRVL